MNGIGVVQDGFPFTEAELRRGRPRFWWGAARKRAYATAVGQRGGTRHRQEHVEAGGDGSAGSHAWATGATAATGTAYVATGGFEERRDGGGGSWSSTDTGSSSDSGGSGGE
jgi:hypothetical protein